MKAVIGIPCAFQEAGSEIKSDASIMLQSYLHALEAAGAAPLLIPITHQESTLRALYERMDGLRLAGGGDIDPIHYGESPHPALGKIDILRDWVELTITPWALADGMPILGICRGIQVLNVVCGGSLWQDISAQIPEATQHRPPPDHPDKQLSHPVHLEPDCLLAAVLNHNLQVNSSHHQAVKEIGSGLRVSARAPDDVIEGLEGTSGNWVVAVQWHPERMLNDDKHMMSLFKAFVDACSRYKRPQDWGKLPDSFFHNK